jgi:tetratricopeptide (TPR) repeat protein
MKNKRQSLEAEFNNAVRFHQAGQIDKAEASYRTILKKAPEQPDVLHLLGLIMHQKGKHETALKNVKKAIGLNPKNPQYNYNCAEIYKALKKNENAIKYYKKAISLNPNYTAAFNNLGNMFRDEKKYKESVEYLKHAVKLNGNLAVGYHNLGLSYKELKDYKNALFCFEKAISINPNLAEPYSDIGVILKNVNQHDKAMNYFKKALSVDPNFFFAKYNIGLTLKELGEKEEAIKYFEEALSIEPASPETHHNLSLLNSKIKNATIIEKYLSNPALNDNDAAIYHYSLGAIYDKDNNFDNAFMHYHKANQLERKKIDYSTERHSLFVDNLIEIYTKSFFNGLKIQGSDSIVPIFIVGMPRSGTTLVEQIVSSHPDVFGAGELLLLVNSEENIIKQIDSNVPYPKCMTEITDSIAKDISNQHLSKLEQYSSQSKHVVDKLPHNFLRIGLIKILFPNARIIHCQRDPLDTCVSIFLNRFALPVGNEFTFDLTELAKYYLDYQRLMMHWQSIFSEEIYDMRYEELVHNQENISKELIEYIGLEWDENCLDFYKNERAVKTMSFHQVRQKIYTGSVKRWKRYQKFLSPLIDIIEKNKY